MLGFDDVPAASTHNPPLTTIRQPLRDMGQSAAVTLLHLIRSEIQQPQQFAITMHPELVVRKSTGHASRRLA